MNPSLFGLDEPVKRIDVIEVPTSDASLRRLRVGRRTVATLPANVVEAMGITVGDAWTESLATAVQQAEAEHTVRLHAQRLLKRRALSRSELIDRLLRKESDSQLVGRIADEMTAAGAIDDGAYAHLIAVSEADRGPISVTYLEHKLQQRGIAQELAHQVAGAILQDTDIAAAAVRFAAVRLRSMSSQPPEVAARRIGAALARRGFDADSVMSVLKEIGLSVSVLEDQSDYHEVPDESGS